MSFSEAAAWGRAGASGWAPEVRRPGDPAQREGKPGAEWGGEDAFLGEEEPPPYSTHYRMFSALQRQILFHQGDVRNHLIKPPLLKQRVVTSVIARLNGMKICACRPNAGLITDIFPPLSPCAGSDTIFVAFLWKPFSGPSVAGPEKLSEWSGHDCSSYSKG